MIIKYKGNNMENSTKTLALNSDITEGQSLREEWNKKVSKDKRQFDLDTKSDGFDTRLGKLIQNLRLRSNSNQIPTSLLREVGINIIDRRRRAEAFWFANNEDECRAFMKTSKKGFTSLTALQLAMKKKADKSDDTTGDTDVEPTEKAETASNVGQLDTTVKMNKFELAKAIQELCISNEIDDAELIEILMLNAEANIQQKAA